MKIPERVSTFHDTAVTTAAMILAEGKEHDPLLFVDGPEGTRTIDLTELFTEPDAKPLAAEVMRSIVARSGSDFAAYIIEAWKATVEGPELDDPDFETSEAPGAVEVLVIHIELREGGVWYWSHDIVLDDAGQRVIDVSDSPLPEVKGDYQRFNLFPRKTS